MEQLKHHWIYSYSLHSKCYLHVRCLVLIKKAGSIRKTLKWTNHKTFYWQLYDYFNHFQNDQNLGESMYVMIMSYSIIAIASITVLYVGKLIVRSPSGHANPPNAIINSNALKEFWDWLNWCMVLIGQIFYSFSRIASSASLSPYDILYICSMQELSCYTIKRNKKTMFDGIVADDNLQSIILHCVVTRYEWTIHYHSRKNALYCDRIQKSHSMQRTFCMQNTYTKYWSFIKHFDFFQHFRSDEWYTHSYDSRSKHKTIQIFQHHIDWRFNVLLKCSSIRFTFS